MITSNSIGHFKMYFKITISQKNSAIFFSYVDKMLNLLSIYKI